MPGEGRMSFAQRSIILFCVFLLFAVPQQVLANSVTGFTLVNADTDNDLQEISDGDTIVLSSLTSTNVNIRANTSPSTVDSVTLNLSGATQKTQTEGVAPYALWGDSNGDYNAGALSAGDHTLTATPKVGSTTGSPLTVNFTVYDQVPGMPVANAGQDHYLVLPDNSVTLQGQGTDSNGTITAYRWTILSGPSGAQLSGADSVNAGLSNLVQGTYTLQLTVTDNDANEASDTALVYVSEQSTVTGGTYLEENGILVMEAEKGVPESTDTWETVTDVADYRGDGFIRWEGSNFYSNTTHGILAYRFKITNGGNYYLRLRSFHDPAQHGEEGDKENDCWTNYELNSTTNLYKTFRSSGNAGKPWTISATTWEGPGQHEFSDPLYQNLQPGEYTFRLAARSQYFMIDRIYLVQDKADLSADLPESAIAVNTEITGELKKWHKVTLTFDGPEASEAGVPNPFTDYRLDVVFTNGSTSYRVPGYFAADGNAAETGATNGSKWRVHFAPDQAGTWHYQVLFRSGSNIITSTDLLAGAAVTPLNGQTGTFTVADTDKSGRDFRGKGMLRYTGGHYLRFAENGEYFLKQGADAPENFLAYDDFDNTPDNGGRRKSWNAHVGDWQDGDPTWQGSKGKGIIGAVNYLASEGMNAFSFIPMNIAGDDKNVFPYISDNAADRTRMDCSKLDQWEVVFEHADKKGMFLHFKTQETENELLLNGGNMGVERTLYYRELIARFGHHLALNWNLGEEINDASTDQKKAWAQYFYDNDPYHHHIVIHNMGDPHYDLLGNASKLTGFSLQTSNADFSQVHSRVRDYITRSQDAGKPWAVACDEPGDASHALRPDNDAGNSHEDGRKNGLWGTFMAGGWGNEWYFGYQHEHSDLSCEDFRSRDNWWDYARYALSFFTENGIPYWEMENDNDVSSADNDYGFYKDDEVYIIYLKYGGTTDLDLRQLNGTFDISWYDPRSGGNLQTGSISDVQGGSWVNLGTAPDSVDQDWAILVRKRTDLVYTLEDAIVATQVLAGMAANQDKVARLAGVTVNGRISLAQLIGILQQIANVR